MSLERALAWWGRHMDYEKGDKLNLMCGDVRLNGWINSDLETYIDPFYPKLPWRDDQFEFIYWNQGPEHIANINAMIQELYRVSIDKAEWYLETVGWKSAACYGDPTHFSRWSAIILNFYRPEGQDGKRYGPAKFTFEFTGDDEGTLEWKCIVDKSGYVPPTD